MNIWIILLLAILTASVICVLFMRCKGAVDINKYSAECKTHFEFVKSHWKSTPFYKKHGVNGSDKSVLKYLQDVENRCML